MNPRHDLDDPNKKCVLLLADNNIDSEDDVPEYYEDYPPLPPFASRDLPDGYELRLQEYRRAWSRCLERVQSLVRALHNPVVEAVCSDVRTAHAAKHNLPGLPFPELPVVAVSAPGGGGSVISDVVASLRHPEQSEGPACIVSNLYPAECPNLMAAMKSIITSFVDRTDEHDDETQGISYPPSVRRKANTSLATYDMNLLKAWYTALVERNEHRHTLVLVMHSFEQFDSTVVEGVFSICSQFLPDLPLVFLLAMSAPSPSGFLRAAFPRRTLQLLRVHTHVAPLGTEIVENIVEEIFFSLEWTPNIMLDSGILKFIAEFSGRHTTSLDALTSVLQLTHLRHVEEPFALFMHDSLLGCASAEEAYEKLQDNSAAAFADALQERFDSPSDDPADVLAAVDEARVDLAAAAEQMRLAYRVLRLLQDFMSSYGYRPSPFTNEDGTEEPRLSFMARVVEGKVSRDVQHLVRMVSKLRRDQLDTLLEKLYKFFYDLEPPQLRHAESESREFIVQCRTKLPPPPEQAKGDAHTNGSAKAAVAEAATDLAEWLSTYLSPRVESLDDYVLSEAWTTGSSPFPSELLNPAPRPAIVHALLHPHAVLASHDLLFGPSPDAEPAEEGERPAIWDLPDTSILLHRYMEAPKKVNVYDWYESFAQVLETQRERARAKAKEEEEKSKPRGKAAKRGGKSPAKARKKQKQDEEEHVEEEGEGNAEDVDDEEWQTELQARFIRALHELDYMGFVKHAGRKADHIVKTIYDVYE
ncbi:origin recognition complex subunit 3 N-terminus-domain-containing protein [Phanerochaete sordida]|uniref:Origin recognition complex subunit 3 N-terminus-domain-containing protein n=1 Tax=Phanerochaete sordida TaxID=48140 RepID=A0A9P3L8P5_9APHY|nr:origin recognition complex subunit 3 N-terminus-domain-containing protein [Phanerochaete sordida]